MIITAAIPAALKPPKDHRPVLAHMSAMPGVSPRQMFAILTHDGECWRHCDTGRRIDAMGVVERWATMENIEALLSKAKEER